MFDAYACSAERSKVSPDKRWPWLVLMAVAALACMEDGAVVVDEEHGSNGAAQSPQDWSAPTLRDRVVLSDDELAREALALLGSPAVGAEGSCRSCHSIGRPTLTHWARLTEAFSDACLQRTELPDAAAVDEMLECFEAHAAPAPAFAPAQFGIYSAAAHLPWFSFVFEHASGSGDWRARHDAFVDGVGMPRAGTPLAQEQFDVVAEWFARGLPRLFELVPEEPGEDCAPGLDPRLRGHVTAMAEQGWRAQNEQNAMLMFGCAEGEQGADCLSDTPLARDEPYASGWDGDDGGRIRILYDNAASRSSYWARTSPDGRFIASGLLDGRATGHLGQFVDLARERVIPADFSYDPTFFPDGSGFLVQRGGPSSSAAPGGGPTNGAADPGDVAVVCPQSVLGAQPEVLSGDEDGCILLDSQIGLYQQLAKSIDGDDYWVVFGSYTSDNGGLEPVLDNPSAAFESGTTTTLTPMINQGASFDPGAPVRVQTPLQGDPMLSPSGRLLVTRVKGRERPAVVDGVDIVTADQSGYALHLVKTERTQNGWSASLEDVGRVCLQGGKAMVSFDERWMVLHHYVSAADAAALGFAGPGDPRFAEYLERGSSNVYLVDLLDGSTHVITHMNAGQYALFPHFRSDGWIYFVVRTLDGEEWFAASDAALLLEEEGR